MSNEIIEFYKKAQEPSSSASEQEQKADVIINESAPEEPFDKFLLELAKTLQTEKVITKKQEETFVEHITQPTKNVTDENDPFKKFISNFAETLKQDKLVNREENIKEATIDFINKLKEQPEDPSVIQSNNKYVPPKIADKVKRLPPTITKQKKVKQEVEVKNDEAVDTNVEQKEEENKYVKELKTADKSNKKIDEKIKSVSDVKSIVEKHITDILSRYPNLGFGVVAVVQMLFSTQKAVL